jgi:hypothetical protein
MPISRETLEAWFPTVQRYVLMLCGLAGVGYETVIDKVDRPYLLVLFGGMLGLSEIAHSFRKDDK